jgi:uridine kinase
MHEPPDLPAPAVSFNALAEELLGLPRRQQTLLVGVDGGGGSGKSTFAVSLVAALTRRAEQAEVVQLDDFYRPHEPQAGPGPDGFVDGELDWRRLREQVLSPLVADREAKYQRFDWPTRTLQEWHGVRVGGVVVVEGIGVVRLELSALFDFRVWVECPRALRLARGVARDGEKARARWDKCWLPAEEEYFASHRPHAVADLRVDGAGRAGLDPARHFVPSS